MCSVASLSQALLEVGWGCTRAVFILVVAFVSCIFYGLSGSGSHDAALFVNFGHGSVLTTCKSTPRSVGPRKGGEIRTHRAQLLESRPNIQRAPTPEKWLKIQNITTCDFTWLVSASETIQICRFLRSCFRPPAWHSLSLSARVLTCLRVVRSVRAYAAAGIIQLLPRRAALRVGAPDSLGRWVSTCMPPHNLSRFACLSILRAYR